MSVVLKLKWEASRTKLLRTRFFKTHEQVRTQHNHLSVIPPRGVPHFSSVRISTHSAVSGINIKHDIHYLSWRFGTFSRFFALQMCVRADSLVGPYFMAYLRRKKNPSILQAFYCENILKQTQRRH